MGRTQTQNMRLAIKEAASCQLCGSKRNIEAHHIIPLSCGGNDELENIICICELCHTKLTPRKLLTKIGVHKAQERFEQMNNKRELHTAIYKKIEETLEEYGVSDAFYCACDAIDSVLLP